MLYIISAGTALVLTLILTLYLLKYGVIVLRSKKAPDSEDSSQSLLCYTVTQSMLLIAAVFIMSTIVNIFLYTYTIKSEQPKMFLFVKIAIVYVITAGAAITDLKRKKIPNPLILFGLASRLIIYVCEFISDSESFLQILKNDVIGFCLGFVFLFIVAVLSKGGIGYGDVKLFGVIGIMVSPGGVFITLLASLIINCIGAVGLIAAKKKTIKSTLPMAPFIWAGFTLVCILGMF